MSERPNRRRERVRRVQELRRSNAASQMPSGKAYQRKAKHAIWLWVDTEIEVEDEDSPPEAS